MLKKLRSAALVSVVGLGLSACHDGTMHSDDQLPAQVQQRINQVCGFLPSLNIIINVAGDILGKPPLSGIAYNVSSKVVEAICTAVKTDELAKKTGVRAFVAIEATNPRTGKVTQRSLRTGKIISVYKP